MQDRTKLAALPFPAFIVIGDVIPIAAGARKVTSFFYDDVVSGLDDLALRNAYPEKYKETGRPDHKARLQWLAQKAGDAVSAGTIRKGRRDLLNIQEALADIPVIRFYVELLEELGILVTPVPFVRPGQSGAVRMYLSTKPLELEPILDANLREARMESVGAFAQYDGLLHGYPECCTAAFVERRPEELQASLNYLAGQKSREQVREGGAFMKRDEAFALLGDAAYQFFSEELYPCSLVTGEQCLKAIHLGKNVFNSIKSELPIAIAQDFFLTNRSLVLDPGGRSSFTTTSQPSDVANYHLPFLQFLRLAREQPRAE